MCFLGYVVTVVAVTATVVSSQTVFTTEPSVVTTESTDPEVSTESDVTPINYTGAQIVRVSIVGEEDVKALSFLEKSGDLEMVRVTMDVADILLMNDSVDHVKEELNQMNMTYNLLVQNLQDSIRKQAFALKSGDPYKLMESGTYFGWNNFYRLADIFEYMEYLENKYPNLVKLETIGHTFEKRPIKILRVSTLNSTKAKAIWVEGGIHAREWISPAATTYIITKVVESLETKNSPFSGLTFYFVPVFNPDGYEYTHTTKRFWRKNRSKNKGTNCIGTDLNRNWNFKWAETSSPCEETYQGIKPFSELETAAISSYMSKVKGLEGYLSLHSYGQFIMFPWAYTRHRTADFKDLYNVAYNMYYQIRRDTGKQYSFGNIAGLLYESYGSSVDWARGKLKVKYSYALELGTDFVVPKSDILNISDAAYAAFKVLAHKINT